MGYLFLAGAIFCEVIATMSLRASESFSKVGFATVVVVGYIAAFGLLSIALGRGIPLGVAYGIWAAVGVAAIALLSIPVFGESLSAIQAGGILLVISGIIALEMGGQH